MGARAKEEGKKLMIFPEGTRNSKKGLTMLPFKKGAFHIAIDGKLPILPVVLSEYDFLDVKNWIFNPGKVTIKVLPRIDTENIFIPFFVKNMKTTKLWVTLNFRNLLFIRSGL